MAGPGLHLALPPWLHLGAPPAPCSARIFGNSHPAQSVTCSARIFGNSHPAQSVSCSARIFGNSHTPLSRLAAQLGFSATANGNIAERLNKESRVGVRQYSTEYCREQGFAALVAENCLRQKLADFGNNSCKPLVSAIFHGILPNALTRNPVLAFGNIIVGVIRLVRLVLAAGSISRQYSTEYCRKVWSGSCRRSGSFLVA